MTPIGHYASMHEHNTHIMLNMQTAARGAEQAEAEAYAELVQTSDIAKAAKRFAAAARAAEEKAREKAAQCAVEAQTWNELAVQGLCWEPYQFFQAQAAAQTAQAAAQAAAAAAQAAQAQVQQKVASAKGAEQRLALLQAYQQRVAAAVAARVAQARSFTAADADARQHSARDALIREANEGAAPAQGAWSPAVTVAISGRVSSVRGLAMFHGTPWQKAAPVEGRDFGAADFGAAATSPGPPPALAAPAAVAASGMPGGGLSGLAAQGLAGLAAQGCAGEAAASAAHVQVRKRPPLACLLCPTSPTYYA